MARQGWFASILDFNLSHWEQGKVGWDKLRRGDVWGAINTALRVGGGQFSVQSHWREIQDVFLNFPLPPADSPTYTWDTPQNLLAQDKPVPVAYGCGFEAGGLLIYQGGDGETRDAFVALSEGTIAGIYDVKLNGVALSALTGVALSTHLGTADQAADPRFATWRHAEAPGTSAWNYKTSDTTPAVGTVTVADADAYVLVKVGVLHSRAGAPEAREVQFSLEWRLSGAGSWTAGGTYRADLGRYQNGLEECRVPLYTTGSTAQKTVTFRHGFTEGAPRVVNIRARAEDGKYSVTQAATCTLFAMGTYEVRLTYVSHSPTDDVLDGQLILAAIEVVEQADATGYPNTAYLAATVQASDLAQGSLALSARLAGRDTVEVWDPGTAAWANRFTNNPVWVARDLWKASRYGAEQPTFDDARAKLAAAYCDETIATLATCTRGAEVGNHFVAVGLTYAGGLSVSRTRLDGYLLEQDSTGERRLILWHDTANAVLYYDRAFTSPPPLGAALTIKEQRFRFDYVFDAQEDVEEAIRRAAAHCRGLVWRVGGTLSFDVARAVAASEFQAGVSTITPDLMLEGTFWTETAPADDAPTGVSVRFLDPDDAARKSEWLAGDATGTVQTLDLYGCVNPGQAHRLAAYALAGASARTTCGFAASLATIALEPGDRVKIAHPVAGWGYDMTDVDAPVRAPLTDLDFLIVSVNDTADDAREYALRLYDAALYTDTDAAGATVRPPSAFVNPFAVPAACSAVYAVPLGDLTDDGVFNPVWEVGWTHPQPDGLASMELWVSRDAAAPYEWQLWGTYPPEGPVRITLPGWAGAIAVAAVPVTVAGVRGALSAAPTTSGTTAVDTTPPAAPTGFATALTSTKAIVSWTPNAEADLSHYRASLDDFATHEIVADATSCEIEAPGSRSFPFYLKAVDRSGNQSTKATYTVSIPAPSAPDMTKVDAHVQANTVGLVAGPDFALSAGHRGFYWKVSKDAGGSWETLNSYPVDSVTYVCPLAAFSGDTLDLLVQAAEVDLVGAGAWSTSKTVTLSKPSAAVLDDAVAIVQRGLSDGVEMPADAETLTALKSNDWAEPETRNAFTAATLTTSTKTLTKTAAFAGYTWASGDRVYLSAGTGVTVGSYEVASKTSDDAIVLTADPGGTDPADVAGWLDLPGLGFALGKNAARFHGGETGFNLGVGGPVVAANGVYLTSMGCYVTATGKKKRWPALNNTNFAMDGQTHWYVWDTAPSAGAWAEVSNLGIYDPGGGGDLVIMRAGSTSDDTVGAKIGGYFQSHTKNALVGASIHGRGVLGQSTDGDGIEGSSANGIGVHGAGGTLGGHFAAGSLGNVCLPSASSTAPPTHSAEWGVVWTTDDTSPNDPVYINTSSPSPGTTWRAFTMS